MRRMILLLVSDETGQDLVEYSLLAALIAVVSISALMTLGPQIPKWIFQVENAL